MNSGLYIIISLRGWKPRGIRERATSYECGLKEYKRNKSKYKIERIVIGIYYLIYDVEYLLLIPIIRNKEIIITLGLYLTTLFEIIFII